MATPTLMPAVFLGHGTPMNALDRNRHTDAWRRIGASMPRPRAILSVSAHWNVNATAVTTMARPRTIHDFFGFPQALFDIQYPAPGLPELAEEVADAVHPEYVGADPDTWGLDHGTWSVLVHAFPDADIPVVQLSINALKPAGYHLELGARLAALRQRGVLLLGTGNVVHNLGAIDWKRKDAGFDWAHRFDDHAREVMTARPGDAASLLAHRDYPMAAPTPEHFLPLLYVAGFAAATGETPEVPVDGYAFGSLSMTCYTVGGTGTPPGEGVAGTAPLGCDAPPEDSNI